MNKIVLWEHPQYFTKFKFNKKKLILHRATMKYYQNYIGKKYDVEYINFNESFNENNYFIFDPIDNIELPNKYNIIESPNFLLNKNLYANYRKKTKSFFFNGFYTWSKKQIDLIPKVKSQDKYNRERFKGNIKIPNLPGLTKTDLKYIHSAKKYVNRHFKDNYRD